mmetsp:Transcript_5823/g.8515  ORF Transcript_5823/g.8515 Transcript_5823/m.8515 type:complete len:81 (-) Transcript_5823:440-682(-)
MIFFAHVFVSNANYLDFEEWRLDLGRSAKTKGKKIRPNTVLAAYQWMEKDLRRVKSKNVSHPGSSGGNTGTVMALTGRNS